VEESGPDSRARNPGCSRAQRRSQDGRGRWGRRDGSWNSAYRRFVVRDTAANRRGKIDTRLRCRIGGDVHRLREFIQIGAAGGLKAVALIKGHRMLKGVS